MTTPTLDNACRCDFASGTGETVDLGTVTVTRYFCDDCEGFMHDTVEHWTERRPSPFQPTATTQLFADGDTGRYLAHL